MTNYTKPTEPKPTLLAALIDENDPEWLTPFFPGFDLLDSTLNDQELAALACAILKLVGNDGDTKSNWKVQALKENLRT